MKKHVLSTVFSAVLLAVLMMIPQTAKAATEIGFSNAVTDLSVKSSSKMDVKASSFDSFVQYEMAGDDYVIAKDAKDAYRKSATLLKKGTQMKLVFLPYKGERYLENTAIWKVMFNQVYEHFYEYRYDTGVAWLINGAGQPVVSRIGGKEYFGLCWRSENLSEKTIKAKKAAANSKANKIIKKKIKKSYSAKKKLQVIHDYLCLNAEYTEAVKNPYIDLDAYAATHPYPFTAYGALVNGDCVCQGYAAAFSLLARKCGIQALGVGSDEMCHAWNMVNVGGKVSYVDVTWDDLGGKNKSNRYFMVSASKLGQDHTWVKSNFAKKFFTWAKGL